MGACIGKKSSKYRKRNQPQSDIIQTPSQPKIQDGVVENKTSPSPSKKLPVTNGIPANNDDESRTSKMDESSIDSELQNILDEQKIISAVFCKPLPSRIISVTDTELEFELTTLMFENPENDIIENSLTVKSNDSR